MQAPIYKWLFALLGGVTAVLCNTAIFIIVCTFAICMDCYTSWELSKRVKAKYPAAATGKFKSKNAKRIIPTMLEIYSLILLAYLIDHYVLVMFSGLFLANFVTGIFCFIQVWSMLENKSSCNGAKWAKMMQKIMIDKAERHFDIDCSDLKNKADENIN